MSINNNDKILLGSITSNLDKRLAFGDVDAEGISLLNLLIRYHKYATEQYNLGVLENYEKIKILNNLIYELKYNCPDICFIFVSELENVGIYMRFR